MFGTGFFNHRQLGIGVGHEAVERNDDGQSEYVFQVGNVFQQVGQTFCQGFEVFFTEVGTFHAAVVFQSADSRHDDRRIRFQTCKAAFDVAEFFRAQIRAEACFGYGVIGKVFRRRVAVTELQPWAMLANGPPCTKAGVPGWFAPNWA